MSHGELPDFSEQVIVPSSSGERKSEEVSLQRSPAGLRVPRLGNRRTRLESDAEEINYSPIGISGIDLSLSVTFD